MSTTKKQQVMDLATQYGIEVEIGGGRHFEVVLIAPTGKQFEDGLHSLVNAAWDLDTPKDVWDMALKDVRNYGPRIQDCPANCECTE